MTWSGRLRAALEPVKRPLQDEACRRRIDPFGPLLARHIHFNQRPFSSHRRQPLVPEDEGQIGFLGHVAHESARGLHPWPFAAIHVDRQTDHHCTHLVALERCEQINGVKRKLPALDHRPWRGQ